MIVFTKLVDTADYNGFAHLQIRQREPFTHQRLTTGKWISMRANFWFSKDFRHALL